MDKIYLSEDDSVDSIVDKIKNSPDKKIDLVVFSCVSSVLSIVNLKLFKELADSLGKEVFISTNDDAVKILSEKSLVKLASAAKPFSAPKNFSKNLMNNFNNFSHSVDSVAPVRRNSASARLDYNPAPQIKGYAAKDAAEFNVSGANKSLLLFFVGMAILAAGAAAYFLLPTAQILITPKTEPMSVKFDFTLDKNASVLNKNEKIVPATAIIASIEKSAEFNATGKKEIFAKATGIITIYNECFTTPISLKANNQVVSVDGKVYYMTQAAVIPPMVVEDGNVIAGTIDTPVISGAAGPQFNIDPMDFSLPAVKIKYRCQKIYARSAAPFYGGATGYTTVVSDTDIKKAEEYLLEEAKKEALKQLEDKKPADLVILPDAISVKEDNLALGAKVDQAANKFKANIKISAIAFLFNPEYIKQIANGLFKETRQDNKDIVFSSLLEADYADASVLDSDKIKMTASVRTFAYQSVDANLIKSKLLSKNMEEARDYIKNNSPEIDKIKITLWPFWVKKVPSIERNVNVSILLDPAQ